MHLALYKLLKEDTILLSVEDSSFLTSQNSLPSLRPTHTNLPLSVLTTKKREERTLRKKNYEMCFSNWYNYKIRWLKYSCLSIPSSHKVPIGHSYLTTVVQIRHEASLQIIHPAWAVGCTVGWSWSTWTETFLGGTKLKASCSPEWAVSGTRLLRSKSNPDICLMWTSGSQHQVFDYTDTLQLNHTTCWCRHNHKNQIFFCHSSLCHQIRRWYYYILL